MRFTLLKNPCAAEAMNNNALGGSGPCTRLECFRAGKGTVDESECGAGDAACVGLLCVGMGEL